MADVDGDGDLDVLAASYLSYLESQLYWFENVDGLASFGPRRLIFADFGRIGSISSADIDADGDTDLVASERLHWFENIDGAGTFVPHRLVEAPNAVSHSDVGDIDGDRDTDILVTTSRQVA